ncbi:MAG: bifunctional hydroxymethylpyrimidine kinase/phosphomethylpyrimidine kinase [Deltaproteobacteria bacterium]|nr:bifunctional hydroxymethylpyrimidine kinase/phosphomethylpyrimidine kinase [Deltaproteobacteria bacterium]
MLTVQSTAGLASVDPIETSLVRAQAERIFLHQDIRAWKTGALGSTDNVALAVALSEAHPTAPLVVDPVIVATRTDAGARLLDDRALEAMRRLVARSTLVTPNVDEAEALLGARVTSVEDARDAALALVAMARSRGAGEEGGHLGGPSAVDAGAPSGVQLIEAPRVAMEGGNFHRGGARSRLALITGRAWPVGGLGSGGALVEGAAHQAIARACGWATACGCCPRLTAG